jgi:hypothetical protein
MVGMKVALKADMMAALTAEWMVVRKADSKAALWVDWMDNRKVVMLAVMKAVMRAGLMVAAKVEMSEKKTVGRLAARKVDS